MQNNDSSNPLMLVEKRVEIKFGEVTASITPFVNDDDMRELYIEFDTPHGKVSFKGEETLDGMITLKGETSRETFQEIANVIQEKKLALKFLNFMQNTFQRNLEITRGFGEPGGFSRELPDRF